ncbi:hypothetical protein F5878DRAFT_689839, partial [Lentinula raphanica]
TDRIGIHKAAGPHVQSPQSWSPPTISLNPPCKRSTKTVYQRNLYCIQNLTHIVMTRPIHNLPLGVLCVILASAIFPGEVLAAPTSFNNPGSLGTVIRARNGLKVDGHVSSCLSSAVAVAGAGAGDGAVHNCDEELNGNAVWRSLTRSLKRRAKFLDGSPFFDTHAAGVHAHGQGASGKIFSSLEFPEIPPNS